MNYTEHYRIDGKVFDYFRDELTDDEIRRRQSVMDIFEGKPGQKVLEIGSGNGWFAREALRLGLDVTVLDLSPDNLSRIRSRDPGIHTIEGDAYAPPIIENGFDWIVAVEVLEHLSYPQIALREWRQRLSDGGRILITVPYREKIRKTLCIHCNQLTPVNAHLHSFDRPKLYRLVYNAGLRVKGMRGFQSKALVHLRLNRLLRLLSYRQWRRVDRFLMNLTENRAHYLGVICAKR